MFVPNLYVCLATTGAADVCFTPGVRLTDSAGSELSVTHQDGADGSVSWPPGQGWWASVVNCQSRGWQTGFGSPPGLGLVGWCMAHQDGDWWPVC